jgi:predicted N-acetyltransferase YhbS
MIAMVDNPTRRGWSVPIREDTPIVICDERQADRGARERLLDEAFGLARRDKTCERLREGRLPADRLALSAHEGPHLIGTLRLWNVQACARAALLLGPLAVAATHRNCGLGARLMEEALGRAAKAGHRAVVLVGDAGYYGRFGFDCALTRRLELPGPVERSRFLGLELVAGGLDGATGIVSAVGTVDSRRSPLLYRGERCAA